MSLAIGFVNLPNLEASSPNDPPLIQVRYDRFVLQLFKVDTFAQMMNHAALGVCGEAGELADAIKKHIHYGKPLDHDNVIEELGDLRFYIQAVQNMLGITEQELLQHNANKLAKRYGSLTYSDKEAVERKDKEWGKIGEANG